MQGGLLRGSGQGRAGSGGGPHGGARPREEAGGGAAKEAAGLGVVGVGCLGKAPRREASGLEMRRTAGQLGNRCPASREGARAQGPQGSGGGDGAGGGARRSGGGAVASLSQ